MIRNIVKPKNRHLTITIPDEYVGQEVEYIVFPLSEGHAQTSNVKSSISQSKRKENVEMLGGILNKYADPSKIELEKRAWELHVADKFRK